MREKKKGGERHLLLFAPFFMCAGSIGAKKNNKDSVDLQPDKKTLPLQRKNVQVLV